MARSLTRSARRGLPVVLSASTALAVAATLALAPPAQAAVPSTGTPAVAAVPAAAASAPLLKLGSRGAAVRTLQQGLNTVLKKDLAVDGVYGPRTRSATVQLQRVYDLAPDGLVGPRTRAKLGPVLGLSKPSRSDLPYGAVLKRGSTGQFVKNWQTALAYSTGAVVNVDGVFGPNTERLTKQIQRRTGLVQDGIAGPKTQRAITPLIKPEGERS